MIPIVAAMDGSFGLIDFRVDMARDPSRHRCRLIAGVELLEIDAEIKAKDSPYLIAVFFDEIRHDPSGRVVVAISVNKSKVTGIIWVDRMMLPGSGSGSPAHLHKFISGVVADGKHLTPMLCAVASIYYFETMIHKVIKAPGLARL